LDHPFDVVDHWAGIRPASSDRRPLIGVHPKHKSVMIFNGMGSKGVMLAPYFARQLIKFMEEGEKLDATVDINRFVLAN